MVLVLLRTSGSTSLLHRLSSIEAIWNVLLLLSWRQWWLWSKRYLLLLLAVAAVAAAAVAQSEHAAAAAAAAVVAAIAVAQVEADSVEVVGCESLDDAHSCFHGGALQLFETQHAQWRDTGGCCHHLHSAGAEEDHLPGTELERVLGSDHICPAGRMFARSANARKI
jgi:hypothetical protein